MEEEKRVLESELREMNAQMMLREKYTVTKHEMDRLQ